MGNFRWGIKHDTHDSTLSVVRQSSCLQLSFSFRSDLRSQISYLRSQISDFQQNFRISTKFQNFKKNSEFRPNFIISAKFQNFNQISDFHQISEFQPNFRMLTKFQNFDTNIARIANAVTITLYSRVTM